MMVLMFGYLFGGGDDGAGRRRLPGVPDAGHVRPDMVFGLEATMVAVTTDAARGVTDRFRSMPMARSAVVVGRGAADMLNSALGLAVLLACGLLVGWRWHGERRRRPGRGRPAALAAVRAALGRHLPRPARQEPGGGRGRADPGLAARLPVPTPSPPPPPCRAGSGRSPSGTRCRRRSPRPASCSATRAGAATSWAAQHALLLAVVWPLLILAVFFPLAVHRWRRLSR